jgi:membrane-associated phospholipid phosphatase
LIIKIARPGRAAADRLVGCGAGAKDAAFALAEVAKKLIAEVRPCYSLPYDYFVDACPARSDYAFPSGHSTTAFATVAALWLLDRRLSAIAAAFALFEGFTRVYLGDHYPHDVLGAALLALPTAYLTSTVLGCIAIPLVDRLRTGVLKPVLTAAPVGAHAAS